MRIRLKHERLAREIASSGLSQNRWAIRLGVSSGQLSELVNGKRPHPPPETRRKLLRGLGVEFEELFEVELPQSPPMASAKRTLVDWKARGYRLRLEKSPAASRARRGNPMRELASDLRYTLRSLVRSPLFAIASVLTLAVGIGANAAIFTLVDAALIRALPYPDPERLAYLSLRAESNDLAPIAMPDWEAIRDARLQAFENVALYLPGSGILGGLDEPSPVRLGHVSPNFFRTLEVSLLEGSGFAGEGEEVVLSHALWRSLAREGLSPGELRLTLDEKAVEVVGVLPAEFRFPGLPQCQVWKALEMRSSGARGPFQFRAVVRLRPEISLQQAQERLIQARDLVNRRFSVREADFDYVLIDLQERFVGSARSTLMLLLAAVGAVLLIATVNVAGLALTRATARSHEIAVRSVLGAGRLRLLRQFVSEGLMLSLAGGVLGSLLAAWLLEAFLAGYSGRWQVASPIAVDGRTLLFALGASILCGLLFSLAPASQLMDTRFAQRIRMAGRGSSGRRQGRLGNLLVSTEFALSLTLLVCAGLLYKSLFLLVSQDPGFRPENVVAAEISLPAARYPEAAQRSAFRDRLLERIRALPSVAAAGTASGLPPDRPNIVSDFYFEGRPLAPGDRPPIEVVIFADNGYFRTVGIPLRKGQWLADDPVASGPPQALIDEELAERYFPGQDPLGQRVRLGSNPESPWIEIRGVVGRVKYAGLQRGFHPALYVATRDFGRGGTNVVVRTSLDPDGLAGPLRGFLAQTDPALAPASIRSLGEMVRRSAAPQRFRAWLMAAFALCALLLSALGIYAVVSHNVGRRIRETGIRMALGASRRDVLALMLKAGMKPAMTGLLIGLGASLALTRLLSDLLYAVQPLDAAAFSAASLAVLSAAFLACLIPARRAAKLNPIESLHCE